MEVLYGVNGKIMGIYGDTRPGHSFQVANWKMAHEVRKLLVYLEDHPSGEGLVNPPFVGYPIYQ
jgi:hypothetical protein